MPKSPRPPAAAIAAPGNREVPTVAAEKIRAAPPVTIGKTTGKKYAHHSSIFYEIYYLLCNYFYIWKMV